MHFNQLSEVHIAVSADESSSSAEIGYIVHIEARQKGRDRDKTSLSVLEVYVDAVKSGKYRPFVATLIKALDATSVTFWKSDYSVYGWMSPDDIMVSELILCLL